MTSGGFLWLRMWLLGLAGKSAEEAELGGGDFGFGFFAVAGSAGRDDGIDGGSEEEAVSSVARERGVSIAG